MTATHLRSAAAIGVLILATALAGWGPPRITVAVSTQNHDYLPSTLRAPAGERFRLVYANQERGAQHNIAVYTEEGGRAIAVSDSIVGPDAVIELIVPPLEPGSYYFQCDIHPFMNGRLIADDP
jgi:plastocyanin